MMQALHTSLQKIRFCNSGFRIFHMLKDTKPIHPSAQGSLNKWLEKNPAAKLERTHLKTWSWTLPLVLLVFYYWVLFIPSLKILLTQVFPLRLHFPKLMTPWETSDWSASVFSYLNGKLDKLISTCFPVIKIWQIFLTGMSSKNFIRIVLVPCISSGVGDLNEILPWFTPNKCNFPAP